MVKCINCKKFKDDHEFPRIGIEFKLIIEQRFENSVFSPYCMSCINIDYETVLKKIMKKKRKEMLNPTNKSLTIFKEESI